MNWNAKSHFKTVFNDILVIHCNITYHWTSQTSRISEKLKKANEGREGQNKGRCSKISKYYDFFSWFRSSGVTCLENAFGLSLKAIKAPKRLFEGQNFILNWGLCTDPNLLSKHSRGSNKMPQVQNWAGTWKQVVCYNCSFGALDIFIWKFRFLRF